MGKKNEFKIIILYHTIHSPIRTILKFYNFSMLRSKMKAGILVSLQTALVAQLPKLTYG